MDSQEERIVHLLTDEINRSVLQVLEDSTDGRSVTELAEALVTTEAISIRTPAYEDRVDRMTLSLHHTHLPELADAGLVEYDTDTNTVSTGVNTAADAEWKEIDVIDELVDRFVTGADADESSVGVVEGREDVYRYGREVVDMADDELFLIYPSLSSVDQDCLPHADDAVERGVDICVGSNDSTVRQFTRERYPEATVWEPQLDWLHEDDGCSIIRRLIFADRETLLISMQREPGDEDSELAMIGDGQSNPLVVLVRELLGARLDHLDYQSEAFLGTLPFEP